MIRSCTKLIDLGQINTENWAYDSIVYIVITVVVYNLTIYSLIGHKTKNWAFDYIVYIV